MPNCKPSYHERFCYYADFAGIALSLWLQRRAPSWLLAIAVLVFGYLAQESLTPIRLLIPIAIPSLRAIVSGSDQAPMLLLMWSLSILFVAVCLMHKRVAFRASMLLYKRCNIILVP